MPRFKFSLCPLWPNRHRGEVRAVINGRPCLLRLSLHALACLESRYDDANIMRLIRRFSEQGMGAGDIDNIIRAGLIGMQNPLGDSDTPLDVEGGFGAASRVATALIMRAFEPHNS